MCVCVWLQISRETDSKIKNSTQGNQEDVKMKMLETTAEECSERRDAEQYSAGLRVPWGMVNGPAITYSPFPAVGFKEYILGGEHMIWVWDGGLKKNFFL